MRPIKYTAILAATLALAGCISFGKEPPPSLLTLTSTQSAAAGTGASTTGGGPALFVLEPETAAAIDVTRVPVRIDDANVAYLKDAVWVEKPARLFRRLLAETLRARTDRIVIDGEDPGVGAGTRIRGTLRDFGYDASTSSAVVRFDAVKDDGKGGIVTRRFESVQPGILAESGPVGDALNRAANDVAGQVADWIG